MRGLAQPACRFIVTVFVQVRRDLQQECQRAQRHHAGQGSRKSPHIWMRYRWHDLLITFLPDTAWIALRPKDAHLAGTGVACWNRLIIAQQFASLMRLEATLDSIFLPQCANADGFAFSRPARLLTICPQILRTSSSVGFLLKSNLSMGT
jgi:hypothetical protein